MGWRERIEQTLQRVVAPVRAGTMETAAMEAGAADSTAKRKTAALPLMLPALMQPGMMGTYRPGNEPLPKPSPINLRKFAETPAPRRAINIIKDRIAGMDWQVRLKRSVSSNAVPDAAERIAILRGNLEQPNATDSFRTLAEQVLEDVLVGGFGAIEMELTGDDSMPFELWPVDGATIRINMKWDGTPDGLHYSQQTNRSGNDALIPLADNELIYIRLNPRTHTPFGLGRLEVAFETVSQFLSAHRFAGKLASNSVVQYALWLNEVSPAQHERLIRWWQDEIEGTGRVPILSCEQKPEVLRFASGTDADLRMEWQQFLLQMIANAFDLPPMLLGVTGDVNKSTAGEMADEAFRSGIAPVAKLFAEYITRDLFAKRLGWSEFEFVFNDLESRNEQEEVAMQTALLTAGVLTVDEVRAMRGLRPLQQATALEEQETVNG